MNTLRVIFEDPHLIVVDKPAGQLVIPGRGEVEGKPLVDEVSSHIRKKAYVVHRIDRETSGLVAFAKDAPTHRELSLLWEGREVQKTYLAWVLGEMDKKEGLLDYPLRTFGSGRMGVDPKGKPSQTRYRVVKTEGQASLLEVESLTGRRHQIRVHLYHAGHPVLGDPLYGQERPVGGASRLLLHAWRLRIPYAGKVLELTCEPSPDFHP
jgi:tRNA pseudouridine32 synthase / 23S rRNA pseudouridine746 synthase